MFSGLVILLLTILLTIAGGWIASELQRRNWDEQKRKAIEDAQIERAQMLADRIIHLCDHRIYRHRLLYWSILKQDNKRIEEALIEYKKALVEWNYEFGFIRTNLKTLFGQTDVNEFEYSIHGKFVSIGEEIEKAIISFRSTGVMSISSNIDGKLSKLSRDCYLFVDMLQQSVRERILPHFEDLERVDFENTDRLRSIDLVKRLFGTTTKFNRI